MKTGIFTFLTMSVIPASINISYATEKSDTEKSWGSVKSETLNKFEATDDNLDNFEGFVEKMREAFEFPSGNSSRDQIASKLVTQSWQAIIRYSEAYLIEDYEADSYFHGHLPKAISKLYWLLGHPKDLEIFDEIYDIITDYQIGLIKKDGSIFVKGSLRDFIEVYDEIYNKYRGEKTFKGMSVEQVKKEINYELRKRIIRYEFTKELQKNYTDNKVIEAILDNYDNYLYSTYCYYECNDSDNVDKLVGFYKGVAVACLDTARKVVQHPGNSNSVK